VSDGSALTTKGLTGSMDLGGGLLATKGLIGSAAGNPGPPPSPPPVPTASLGSTGAPLVQIPIVIVIPTATNVALIASQNITDNLRQGRSANLTLPSLYKRAYLVAHQTDEIALARRSGS
jgi:hypothetical protein